MTAPAGPGYRIAVALILLDAEDRFLVLERATNPPGWAPPGGRCEPPESPNATVVRELREETGLSCSRFMVFNTWYGDIGPHRTVGLDYVGLAEEGEVRLSSEHRAFRWLTLDGLARAGLPMATGFEPRFFERAVRVARDVLRRLPPGEQPLFTAI